MSKTLAANSHVQIFYLGAGFVGDERAIGRALVRASRASRKRLKRPPRRKPRTTRPAKRRARNPRKEDRS